jgi:hypothetical protein
MGNWLIWRSPNANSEKQARRLKMRDRQFSQEGALLGSSHSELSALTLPMDDDAALLALEAQFDSLIAELVAAPNATDATAIHSEGRSRARAEVQAGFEHYTDHEDRTEKTEAILARLYPIEQAIMTTPPRTINGLGIKARHAAYVMSHYWEAPIDQLDWDARATRLLIEAVCELANIPLPNREAATDVSS